MEASAFPIEFVGIYVVEPWDTLSAIGRRLGVSIERLTEVNNINNPGFILVDQVLLIPPSDLSEVGLLS